MTQRSAEVILRGNCIVMPNSLHQRVISIAHRGHQGLVQMKKLFCEKVWFPKIDHEVKEMINQCVLCQASSMIPKMDRIFATHGIRRVVKINNGPPFASEEIKVYMEEKAIKHSQITPLWPEVNSEAEKFMNPVTKAIRTTYAEGRD